MLQQKEVTVEIDLANAGVTSRKALGIMPLIETAPGLVCRGVGRWSLEHLVESSRWLDQQP